MFSLRSSSSCLHLLPHLSFTSTLPSIIYLMTCFKGQRLSEMWPFQLTFLYFVVLLSSLTPCNISSFFTRTALTDLFHHSPAPRTYFWSIFWSVRVSFHTKLYSKGSILLVSSWSSSAICWWQRVYFSKAVFAVLILDLISCVHLASFVITLPRQLKCSTLSSCFCSITMCTVLVYFLFSSP